MTDFVVDKDVAKAALLYVVANVPNIDMHKLYKILYFAEQDHLVKFGKPITGDSFIKMQYGPVPSYTKDKIEQNLTENDNSVRVKDINVIITEYPDLDELSESNLASLNYSIETYKDKTFSELVTDSHKEAWTNAKMSSRIDSISIAAEINADQGVLEYIKQNIDNCLPIY